jgi:phosphoglycerate dehydrogenase-like enzyme
VSRELAVGVSPGTFEELGPTPRPWLRLIALHGADGQAAAGDDADEGERAGPDVEVLWRRQRDATAWAVQALRDRPAIRWLHTDTAGVDRLPLEELNRRSIVLSNARGAFTPAVSEWAMAAILMAAKRLDMTVRNGMNGVWWAAGPSRELAGSTVVVVGLGSIGAAVASLCHGMGMRVIGVVRDNRSRQRPAYVDTLLGVGGAWEDVLGEASYIVLCTPLTTETRGLIGAGTLERMNPGAWLINAARGEIVDEKALLAALDRRKLAGAVLDAFVNEPLPPESPFWGRDNVVVSPHVASHSDRTADRTFELFIQEAERYLLGYSPVNSIEYSRGY